MDVENKRHYPHYGNGAAEQPKSSAWRAQALPLPSAAAEQALLGLGTEKMSKDTTSHYNCHSLVYFLPPHCPHGD